MRFAMTAIGSGASVAVVSTALGGTVEQSCAKRVSRDARGCDPPFCAYQSLRHRGFQDKKRACNFRRGETAHSPERESDLSLARECRMTTGEDQAQAVVTIIGSRFHRQFRELFPVPTFVLEPVQRAPRGYRHEPGPRVVGDAATGPDLNGLQQSILGALLCQVEVTEAVHEFGGNPPRFLAENIDQVVTSWQSLTAHRLRVARQPDGSRPSPAPARSSPSREPRRCR
jgi:hypothetical protein